MLLNFTIKFHLSRYAKVGAFVFVVNSAAVNLLCTVTCLGVSVDQELTFADHIRSLACRCFYWIRQLRSVRRTLTFDTITALVSALIISRLDYCNGVLRGLSVRHPPAAVARCTRCRGEIDSWEMEV